jgi:hypothetical protein
MLSWLANTNLLIISNTRRRSAKDVFAHDACADRARFTTVRTCQRAGKSSKYAGKCLPETRLHLVRRHRVNFTNNIQRGGIIARNHARFSFKVHSSTLALLDSPHLCHETAQQLISHNHTTTSIFMQKTETDLALALSPTECIATDTEKPSHPTVTQTEPQPDTRARVTWVSNWRSRKTANTPPTSDHGWATTASM